MKNLYTQDSETISMYELHAINLLKAMNLLSPDDCFDNIRKSRNYMLVQLVANSVFVKLGLLTYEEISESIKEDSSQTDSAEIILETESVIYWGVPEHLASYERHIANLLNPTGLDSVKSALQSQKI